MSSRTTYDWLGHLQYILNVGHEEKGTREVVGATFTYNTAQPVINCSNRGINYKFMAAEASYILQGRNDIQFLADIIPKFSKYSDDGYFQAGAYGPMVIDQLPYVLACLENDISSRQAVITIWRPRPMPSKDIPCTVSMQFLIRDGFLHTIVNMRSSDAFMGLIYDTFCFAAISMVVAASMEVDLGQTKIFAGSFHIYERDWTRVVQLIADPGDICYCDPWHPTNLYDLVEILDQICESDAPLKMLIGDL